MKIGQLAPIGNAGGLGEAFVKQAPFLRRHPCAEYPEGPLVPSLTFPSRNFPRGHPRLCNDEGALSSLTSTVFTPSILRLTALPRPERLLGVTELVPASLGAVQAGHVHSPAQRACNIERLVSHASLLPTSKQARQQHAVVTREIEANTRCSKSPVSTASLGQLFRMGKRNTRTHTASASAKAIRLTRRPVAECAKFEPASCAILGSYISSTGRYRASHVYRFLSYGRHLGFLHFLSPVLLPVCVCF